MDTKDWIQILSTIILAVTAFIAPYAIEKWKTTYHSPKLKINFKLAVPGCHLTKKGDSPTYYFRFLVENIGKTQANECEVLIERIFKENSARKMIEFKNFSPVNLKWSGLRDPFTRTIQPGRKMFCDIGRVQHPSDNYISKYRDIKSDDQELNKFIFELPEIYFSQWDCLIPGKYKILISLYSKNAKKISKEFNISWSGHWKDTEQDMFNELVIS